ncbi:MAG TPA: GGDEF domain-containing protein [Oculatellaceae cyanobacterium]
MPTPPETTAAGSDSSAQAQKSTLAKVWSDSGDLLRAAAYSAIERPIDGLLQDYNHALASVTHTTARAASLDLIAAPQHSNMWTTIGSGAGQVVDYYLLSKLVGRTRLALTGSQTSVPVLEAGTTGAIFEAASPVSEKDFGKEKFNNMALGFVTFASIDGVDKGLTKLSPLRKAEEIAVPQRRLVAVKKIAFGALSGASGGLAHSLVDAQINHKALTAKSVAGDMLAYGVFSASLQTVDVAAGAGKDALTKAVEARVKAGKPLFSLGPFEIHKRGFADETSNLVRVDDLTGLKNKAAGNEVLEQQIAHARRQNEPLSVTYMDLNGFGAVNKSLGHAKGDAVLVEFANQLKGVYKRATDFLGRDGGDEFMVVSPNTSLEQANKLAAKVESEVRIGVGRNTPAAADFATNFSPELTRLKALDRTVSIQPGRTQTVGDLAVDLLSARTAVTGELMSTQTIEGEVNRLAERLGKPGANADTPLEAGQIKVYNEQDLIELGRITSFRFVPKIGQILKSRGIATEQQLQDIVAYQKTFPKGQQPLLGEILVERKIATEDQVRAAFQEQMAGRDAVNAMLAEAFPKAASKGEVAPESAAGANLTKLEERVKSTWIFARLNQWARSMRDQIPDVLRPQLGPSGLRTLWSGEQPLANEIVVTASTGVAELQRGPGDGIAPWSRTSESAQSVKDRADKLMLARKRELKAAVSN